MNNKLRNFVKEHLPFIKNAYATVRNAQEKKRIQHLNEVYRRTIEPLKNPAVLEQHIAQLDAAASGEKKTYYVIAQQNTKVGIYGYLNCFLPHIAYAVAKGYIPVIDMRSYRNIYTPKDRFGSINAWELFFRQPMDVGLDDLSDGEVIRCPDMLWYHGMPNSCPMMSDQELGMWSALYKKYIRHNEKSEAYIHEELTCILDNPNRTIGALYRGTDYIKGHPIGHPIQPSMKVFADKVEKLMQENGYELIYLASEEKGILNYMNQRFPGRILINKRVYYDEVQNVDYSNYNVDHIGVSGAYFDREDNEYLIGMEYISSMNLVANCAAFVAGACGGTTAVLYMNNLRFEEKYIFNLGKYGFDPIPEEE